MVLLSLHGGEGTTRALMVLWQVHSKSTLISDSRLSQNLDGMHTQSKSLLFILLSFKAYYFSLVENRHRQTCMHKEQFQRMCRRFKRDVYISLGGQIHFCRLESLISVRLDPTMPSFVIKWLACTHLALLYKIWWSNLTRSCPLVRLMAFFVVQI